MFFEYKVTFTAACPGCGEDREWHADKQKRFDGYSYVAYTIDCECEELSGQQEPEGSGLSSPRVPAVP